MVITVQVKAHPQGGFVAHCYRPGKSGDEWSSASWGSTIQEAEDRARENFSHEVVTFIVKGGIRRR